MENRKVEIERYGDSCPVYYLEIYDSDSSNWKCIDIYEGAMSISECEEIAKEYMENHPKDTARVVQAIVYASSTDS